VKIRDKHATINGDKTIYEMPSGGIEVIGDDGKTLFIVSESDGRLEVAVSSVMKHKGKLFDDRITVEPKSANRIYCVRPLYKE